MAPHPLSARLVCPRLACRAQAGSFSQRERWLAPAIRGEHKLSLAYLEPGGRYDPAVCRTLAATAEDSTTIMGSKKAVLFGAHAKLLIVSAQIAQTGEIGLFAVEADARGVAIEQYRTYDGGSAARVIFCNANAEALRSAPQGGFVALQATLDMAGAIAAADAVGSMWAVQEATLDYLKIREQFGAPLATFQALQHRLVEMYIQCE
ncbi:MAG: hypothetical protein HOI95_27885, partial [Chromatiales bacterium]|nr:hypothetical protein [Chromatiales bacterium]